jgi:hypothetical protein
MKETQSIIVYDEHQVRMSIPTRTISMKYLGVEDIIQALPPCHFLAETVDGYKCGKVPSDVA